MEREDNREREREQGEEAVELHPSVNYAGVQRAVTVACCFLFSFTLGTLYAVGNINPYLTSYLRNRTGHHDTDYTDTLWIYQAPTIVEAVSMAPVGLLANRLPTKLFLALGFLCNAVSLFGTYWSMQRSYAMVMLTFGVLSGLPLAIVDPVSIQVSVGWAPDRKGLICGLVFMGYGAGAVVWNEVTTWFINPSNLQPDRTVGQDVYFTQAEVLDRVPDCFLLLGGVCTGVQFLCLLLLRLPPARSLTEDVCGEASEEEKKRLLQNDDDDDLSAPTPRNDIDQRRAERDEADVGHIRDSVPGAPGGQQGARSGVREAGGQQTGGWRGARGGEVQYSPGQVLKSRVFWTLWLNMVTMSIAISFFVNLSKAYGQTFISNDHFLALVASLGSVCNAAGRPFWGFLADRIGLGMVFLLVQSILAALVGSFVTCEATGKAGFLIWVCGMYLSMGGVFTLEYPLFLALFGSHHYNVNVGLLASYGLISSILSGTITSSLKDLVGWHGMFFIAFGGLFVGMLLNMSLSIRRDIGIPEHMWPVLSIHG